MNFLESKVKSKNYSKNDLCLISQIKNDLYANEANLAENFANNIKLDLFLSSFLNKKSNAFSLIGIAKELDYHINALNRIDVSTELSNKLEHYSQRLKENKTFVIHLCKQKQDIRNKRFL